MKDQASIRVPTVSRANYGDINTMAKYSGFAVPGKRESGSKESACQSRFVQHSWKQVELEFRSRDDAYISSRKANEHRRQLLYTHSIQVSHKSHTYGHNRATYPSVIVPAVWTWTWQTRANKREPRVREVRGCFLFNALIYSLPKRELVRHRELTARGGKGTR